MAAEVQNLMRVQDASYLNADGALRGSWPRESAMDEGRLESFLEAHCYCVLATTTSRNRAQARPVAFVLFEGGFWFATVKGGRLRNLERTPWASMVVAEGEGSSHCALVVDGPVKIGEPPAGLIAAWEARLGSKPDWAAAWFELRPMRLYSYMAASKRLRPG